MPHVQPNPYASPNNSGAGRDARQVLHRPRVIAVLMLTASLAAVILPLYLAILQLFTDKSEYSKLIVAIPIWVFCIPGILTVSVLWFTVWHAIRNRASLQSFRGWVIALAVLQLIAAFAYWIMLFRRTPKDVMQGAPDLEQHRSPK